MRNLFLLLLLLIALCSILGIPVANATSSAMSSVEVITMEIDTPLIPTPSQCLPNPNPDGRICQDLKEILKSYNSIEGALSENEIEEFSVYMLRDNLAFTYSSYLSCLEEYLAEKPSKALAKKQRKLFILIDELYDLQVELLYVQVITNDKKCCGYYAVDLARAIRIFRLIESIGDTTDIDFYLGRVSLEDVSLQDYSNWKRRKEE